jgi:hypothetical protein
MEKKDAVCEGRWRHETTTADSRAAPENPNSRPGPVRTIREGYRSLWEHEHLPSIYRTNADYREGIARHTPPPNPPCQVNFI